ncbi:hypothetical protein HID58_079003 [Brassica napus]|uniref:Uncharacterized protein n=1 Tax=Brassica napus TaxID=3708 RepID=A0ABQ7Y2H7_BRANA|nr:hypothetical protein HID58_079003 [Brassica napus]
MVATLFPPGATLSTTVLSPESVIHTLTIPGCSHPGCEPAYPTPKCVRKCVSGNQLWRESKHYGVSAYKVRHDPQDIMGCESRCGDDT